MASRTYTAVVRSLFAGLLLVGAAPAPGWADQVIADDLIVQSSLCTGPACVNAESFGFDTVRLKGEQLRLGFVDTSASAGFPSNDWQIAVNDLLDGGQNHFSIVDVTGSTVPFRIAGGAPDEALWIDALGHVGVGTGTPSVALDVDGDAHVSGTLTVGTFTPPSALAVEGLTVANAASAASVTVDGAASVGGNLTVTGTVNGRDVAADGAVLDALASTVAAASDAVRAGVIPASAFSVKRPTANVVYAAPYPPNTSYVVMLTVLTKDGRRPPAAIVVAKSAAGFTVKLGASSTRYVDEVQWFTRTVGE